MAVTIDWQEQSYSSLIDYIVSTHHSYLNKQMPFISELLTHLVRKHWFEYNTLLQVHTLFHQLKAELDQHMIKEETKGFVLIKAYEANPGKQLEILVKTIDSHMNEHDSAITLLKEIRQITGDYQAPESDGGICAYTFRLLQELEADLIQHIYLENDILFARMRREIQTS